MSLALVSDNRGAEMSIEEKRAFTRDNLARDDPDELWVGFFPAWAVCIYILGGII